MRCNTGAFVDHLLALHESRQSGVMSVHAEGSVIDVYFRRGTPIFAEGDTLAGSLGRSLLSDGTLTSEQYEHVVGEMTKTVFDSEDMCLAEVVVQLGYLDHQSVNERLERHVRTAIMACMRWAEPEIQFLQGNEAPALVASYPSAVQPLVLAGVRTHYDMRRSEDVWRPNAESYADLARPPGETAKIYAMKPDELRYISFIDGTRRIDELVHTGDLEALHAGQIIAALLLTDGVRLFAAPAATDIESVKPIPSVAVVSDAARRRMSSPLLRAVPEPAPGFVEAPAVPEIIHPQPMRAPRPLDRARADRIFAHGKRFMSSRALGKALQAFERAQELDSSSTKYALYAEWCRFIKSPPADSAAVLGKLFDLATETLAQEERLAFAHYVCGRVALARGDYERARRALKVATRLDPGNEDARRFLRSVKSK